MSEWIPFGSIQYFSTHPFPSSSFLSKILTDDDKRMFENREQKKKNIPPRPRFIILSRAFYRSATVANRWRQKRAAESVYFIYFFFSSSLPTGSSCAEKCRRAASSSSFTTHQTRCRSARRARRHTTTSISCSAGRTRACPPDVIVAFARDEIGKIDRSIDRSRARWTRFLALSSTDATSY